MDNRMASHHLMINSFEKAVRRQTLSRRNNRRLMAEAEENRARIAQLEKALKDRDKKFNNLMKKLILQMQNRMVLEEESGYEPSGFDVRCNN